MSNLNLPEGMSDTLENQLANQLHSLSIHILRDARKNDLTSGLTPERLSILSILVYTGSKTVNELASMEQVSAPAITRTVKSLEKEGYVIKAKSRADQRVVFVSATRKSIVLMEQTRTKRIERIVNKVSQLNAEQQTELQTLLELLN
ncbi:MarR family winged helix-turn-helix transcriptional regulator [Kangiella sp. HZ709]|uniref:MarR family winged helix-turn-helix transcriptional regulator n=1 Tax=Kangiella sp. HZ709 TaxID=2666328 RepID=UPI001D0D9AE9|nr:MarR family transcriptional regulator [Kangiella sp. HZ709]